MRRNKSKADCNNKENEVKKQLAVLAAVSVPIIGLAGTALAHDNGGVITDNFAEKFASKFNLNKEEVNTFLNEEHKTRHAERDAKIAEALKSAGLSDEQAAALKDKKTELREAHQTWHEQNPDATIEERQAQRDSERATLETWAKEQGIDLEKVRSTLVELGIGKGHGMGGRGMMKF